MPGLNGGKRRSLPRFGHRNRGLAYGGVDSRDEERASR